MRTIHKFIVDQDNTPTRLMIRQGGVILHGDYQGSQLCVWAEVDTEKDPSPRFVQFVGTGRPVPVGAKFINTFLIPEMRLVFHVYELE